MNAIRGLYGIAIGVMALFVYTCPMHNKKPADQGNGSGKKSVFHMRGHLRKTGASVDKITAKQAIELQELHKQVAAIAVMHEDIAVLEDLMSAIRLDYFSKTQAARENLRSYSDFKLHHDNQLHHLELQLQYTGERLSQMNAQVDLLERALPPKIQ